MPTYDSDGHIESPEYRIEPAGDSSSLDPTIPEKLAADWQLYQELRQEDFDGPVWQDFVELMPGTAPLLSPPGFSQA
jgi:hypothetical protein